MHSPAPHSVEMLRTRLPLFLTRVSSFVVVASGAACSSDDGSRDEIPAPENGTPPEEDEQAAPGDGDGDGDGDDQSFAGGGSTAMSGDGDGDGDGSGGGPPSGCGQAPSSALGAWQEQAPLTVEGSARAWSIRFPTDYDPSRTYPAVFLFHGCGGETDVLPLEDVADDAAILVRGVASGDGNCWSGYSEQDDEFFVEMLASVTASACIDSENVYAIGYDSGATVVNRIGCTLAYLLDGVATIGGENVLPASASCTGPVSALIIHDEGDPEVALSAGEEVRDRFADQNFCVADGIPEPTEPEPCVSLSGCGRPVVWCQTTSQGHDRQDAFVGDIWDFLSR